MRGGARRTTCLARSPAQRQQPTREESKESEHAMREDNDRFRNYSCVSIIVRTREAAERQEKKKCTVCSKVIRPTDFLIIIINERLKCKPFIFSHPRLNRSILTSPRLPSLPQIIRSPVDHIFVLLDLIVGVDTVRVVVMVVVVRRRRLAEQSLQVVRNGRRRRGLGSECS